MDNTTRDKAVNLIASYFANWKACDAAQNYKEGREYYAKYSGALQLALLLGVDNDAGENALETEIQSTAYKLYGDAISTAYNDTFPTW